MILQIIINKFLAMDPFSEEYLAPLNGKTIAIICNDFPMQNLYCTFTDCRVLLTSSAPELIDLTVSASLKHFIKYALTKDNKEIHIAGNIAVAQLLQTLLTRLDIDWEEELSKYTGDVIAHQALNLFTQLRHYQQSSSNSLAEMISEYLQEEAKLLPTKYEVQAFMREVDELRLAVDRLDSKVAAYESN